MLPSAPLMMASPPLTSPTPPGHPKGPWLWGLAVVVLGLSATGFAWTVARKTQVEQDQGRLARFVGRTELGIQNRLGRYEDIVRGAQGFISLEPEVIPEARWRSYVDALDLPQRHPGVSSLAVIRNVPASGLASFLESRPQLKERYHLPTSDALPPVPPPADQGHFIIELCEPANRSTEAIGLDVGAGISQRLAADRARDTGLPILSGLLHFTQPGGRKDALALLAPIYDGTPVDAQDRRTRIRSWVSAGILIGPMVQDILQGEDLGVALEIVDVYSTQGPQRLFRSPEWPEGAKPDALRSLTAGGRGWELHYAILPSFYKAEERNGATLLLLGGIAVSLSLAALVWSLAGLRLRALALAKDMNATLFESLQRNRSHLESTPLAIIETDHLFRIREWNHAAVHIFGYSRDEALGKDPRMLLPPEGQGEVAPRREALLAGTGGTRVTLENVTRTGQRILCDWYNTALRDEAGHLLGAIFLADDVTERRQAEAALRQAQKLESLGVLAGGIAHDFNNLLTVIMGNTEVAQDLIPDNPALRNALQRIEATSQRGADLARQLLAYAGKAHFQIKPLDLNSVILELGDLLSVSISKKVALRQDLQQGLPPVEADSAQFQQVVMNLVINASEAIGDRTGTVTIRTRSVQYGQAELSATFPGQVLEPGTYVRMEVEDDGVGMDAETIGRIFDPFFTTKFTGRGLGLSAMLGIVRGHRAGIRVESTPGEGTNFILLFPATEATVVMPSLEPTGSPAVTGTVLVVDDEGVIRDLARSALEASGIRVLEARDGLEALEIFQTRFASIDLVLLDMTMPRMGGAEAFQKMRQISPGIKVLLTSGYTQRESVDALVGLPPDGFLQKPFRVRELVAKVRDLMRNPDSKQNK